MRNKGDTKGKISTIGQKDWDSYKKYNLKKKIFNYKNKIFLGDSGAFILSGIIGFILIDQYQNEENFFSSDEIFVILMVPGIDMLRLFISRIYKKQNPFFGDLADHSSNNSAAPAPPHAFRPKATLVQSS